MPVWCEIGAFKVKFWVKFSRDISVVGSAFSSLVLFLTFSWNPAWLKISSTRSNWLNRHAHISSSRDASSISIGWFGDQLRRTLCIDESASRSSSKMFNNSIKTVKSASLPINSSKTWFSSKTLKLGSSFRDLIFRTFSTARSASSILSLSIFSNRVRW